MNYGLTDELKAAFPNIIPARPLIIDKVIPSKSLIAGICYS